MADDNVTIWGNGLKFGRKTANGELLIGDGVGFKLATLTAGAGASISNTAGGITISATGTGGTVTSVTASSPLASSGGNTPDISLNTVPVDKGGTGQTSLTSNNVILGNGTSAVQFVAPGTTGNVLTSNGTTWASTAPVATWTLIKKIADQSIVNSVTYTDDNTLQFSMAASKTYSFRSMVVIAAGAGGFSIAVNGPASPTRLRVSNGGTGVTYTTYNTQITNSASAITTIVNLRGTIVNGANSGTFAIRISQTFSNAAATVFEKGGWLEWTEIV